MDHAKETWEAFQNDVEKGTTYWRIRFDSNSGDSLHGYCGEANARRIVACVNACAGIETERLESGSAEWWGKYVRDDRPAMEREIASLRSALAEKTAQVERLRDALDDLVMACELPGDNCEVEQALRNCRETIAREALAATAPDVTK